jgi:hypothetical protein
MHAFAGASGAAAVKLLSHALNSASSRAGDEATARGMASGARAAVQLAPAIFAEMGTFGGPVLPLHKWRSACGRRAV